MTTRSKAGLAILALVVAAGIGVFFRGEESDRSSPGDRAERGSAPHAESDATPGLAAASSPGEAPRAAEPILDSPDEASPPPAPAVAPPGLATVELIDAETRAPVPGLVVVFDREPFGPGAPSHRATSDSLGRIDLDGLPVGRWHGRTEDDFLFLGASRAWVDVLFEREPAPSTLAVERGALVLGSVVDKRGEPVAGARVGLRLDWDATVDESGMIQATWDAFERSRPERYVAESGSDGRFAIRAVPGGGVYSLEATHPRFAPSVTKGLAARASEIVEAPPITLGEGGRLRVGVTRSEKPVPGAEVRVAPIEFEEYGHDWPEETDPNAPAATSDGNGVADLPRLRAGTYAVVVLAPESKPFRLDAIAVEDEVTTAVAAALEPGLALAGVVVDAQGRPVAGALVEARRDVKWEGAKTGSDGRFRVAGLAPQEALVRVSAAGFAAQRCEIDLLPEDVRIELRREASVSGHVVDADGKPVVRYRITAEPQRDGSPFVDFGDSSEGVQATRKSLPISDDAGRFVVPGLLAGRYVFRIDTGGRGQGSGASEIVTVEDGAAIEGLRIGIERSARVRARVVDAATREPLFGASVTWASRPDDSGAEFPDEWSWRRPGGVAATSGADGWLDFEVPLSCAALSVRRDGYLPQKFEAHPEPATPGGVVEMDVTLARGGTVTGTVRDASGAPVESASLSVSGLARNTRTDSAGNYTVSGLAPGEYRVGLLREESQHHYSEFAPFTIVGDETVRVDFAPGLRPGSRVFGVVSSAGHAVAGADVYLSDEEGGFTGVGAITGDDGAFDFASLPAGDYAVTVRLLRFVRTQDIAVDGESPVRVDFVLPGGRLVATAIDDATGAPVGGVAVSVTDADETTCYGGWTDSDGRVELSPLAAGPATVQVGVEGDGEPRKYVPQTVEASIPETGAAAIVVRLHSGTVLEGRVTGPDGKPLAHPVVEIHHAGGGVANSSSGDYRMAVEGRYRVEGLSPGSYVAVIRGKSAPTTVVSGVRVEAPGPNRADFTVPRGGSVVVRVVDSTGAKARHAYFVCDAVLPGGGRIRVDEGNLESAGESSPLRLAPGEYVVRLLGRLFDPDVEGEGRAAAGAEATVIAGETTVVTLTMD